MAITLLYGLEKPQTPDKGSVFFPILEDNIDWMEAHTHNGTNSATIASSAVTSLTQDLAAASWVLVSNGIYRQLVTMTSGVSFENHIPRFVGKAGGSFAGEVMYLHYVKASANTFYVYINDNSLDITIVYK